MMNSPSDGNSRWHDAIDAAERTAVGPPTDFGMPSRQHVAHFVVVSCYVSMWFVLVYGTCNWITGLHNYRLRISLPWEDRIPFYPSASLVYMSIYPLFGLIPFVLRTRRDLNRLGAALGLLIGLAGIGFLLLPSFPIPRSDGDGMWVWLFQLADTMNLTYNDLPSLHVGLTVACVSAMCRSLDRATSIGLWSIIGLWCWAAAVAWSTLLMHEHYVIDVLAGWCLAVACVRISFRQRPSSVTPTSTSAAQTPSVVGRAPGSRG